MKPARKQDFYKIDSRVLEKTGRNALVRWFLCLQFSPVSGPLLVGFLSRSPGTLSGSLRSGILCENYCDIFNN